MNLKPISEKPEPARKLESKVALITDGYSGIGKAVAILFARKGADIAISYLNKNADALETKQRVDAINNLNS